VQFTVKWTVIWQVAVSATLP